MPIAGKDGLGSVEGIPGMPQAATISCLEYCKTLIVQIAALRLLGWISFGFSGKRLFIVLQMAVKSPEAIRLPSHIPTGPAPRGHPKPAGPARGGEGREPR